ncbi:MAG: serine/threonine protein kinase [Gemmatimonadaceae bacterium]|nr:serine/threonine protein kinase [Gemmatimonadaceae bacterium]
MTAIPLQPDIAPLAAALAGQYEIERELGRGGMGIVYLAHDVKLEREVAIKVLPPMLAGSADVRERFLREARTSARLTHPNIVAIHGAGEIDSRVYFVMGFVDGESLAERLRRDGPLDPAIVIPILRDVALALSYAHERGVVHRDIKPENILIDARTGRAMVTDFGIARVAEAAPLTMTGQVLGSVHYMSPEQVSGDRLDGRSDLYSLGVVGFQALSGRLPFDNESASAVIVAHVTKPAPALLSVAPNLPSAIAAVIDRCLAKSPDARYATGDALASALDHAWDEKAWERQKSVAAQLLSDTQAQAVWQRAADLQQATESHPAAPIGVLPVRAAPSVTSGIAMERVRESAVEAGIAEEHVARAASELGLSPRLGRREMRPEPPFTPPANRPILTPLFAAPFRLQEEGEVAGEIPPAEYEMIVERIRETLGDEGSVSTLGRTLTWSSRVVSRKGRNVSVTISPRRGNTRIRIDERMGQLAGGLYGGIVGGTSSLAVLAFVSVGQATHWWLPGLAAGLAVELTTFSIARTIIGMIKGKRRRQLEGLRQTLEADVRESIAAGPLLDKR